MDSPDSVEQANPYSLSWLRVKDGVAWVRHRWVFFLLVAFTLLVIPAFTPYLVSTFYLELGGRKLDQVLNLKSQFPMPNTQILHPNSPFSLSDPPVVNPDSGHLSVAIAHLRQAIYWDGNNAQAYRLLGQAYLAQGDYLAAIEALTTYTDLRPDNPLGHLGLAQIYDGLARASESEEVYYDFIEHLPEATVTTPGAPIQTDYCLPNGPVASCYVASTYWTMPDDMLRPVLFMHPSSWARYVVTVSAEAPVLRFSVGMYPPSRNWEGDGALFEVCIQNGAEEKRLFSTHVGNAEEDWGWHDGEVDLTPYVGQVVTLTLGAHPGLQGDPTGDWAGWAEPRLEGRDALQRWVEAEKWRTKAVAEWQAAGLTAQDFIAQGEKERRAKRYGEALGWYERATVTAPGLGDPWYYMGLAYEKMEQWGEALVAFQKGLSLPLVEISQSDIYYRVGWLQSRKVDPPDLAAALAAFDTAIAQDQFVEKAQEVQAHYQRADALHRLGLGEEALREYEWVVARQTEHYWACVHLGNLYWRVRGDAERAETVLMRAVHLESDMKWAYRVLARVYQETSREAEAIEMYRQVLSLDPQDELALEQIDRLISLERD